MYTRHQTFSLGQMGVCYQMNSFSKPTYICSLPYAFDDPAYQASEQDSLIYLASCIQLKVYNRIHNGHIVCSFFF